MVYIFNYYYLLLIGIFYFYRTIASYLNIRAGTAIRNSGGVTIDVSIIYQHPEFSNVTYDYDIAVLELVSDLTFSDTIIAISLPNENQQLIAGTESVVTGWGATEEDGIGSNQLLMVEVPLVSATDCQPAYAPNYVITERMLCAGFTEGGKDACEVRILKFNSMANLSINMLTKQYKFLIIKKSI